MQGFATTHLGGTLTATQIGGLALTATFDNFSATQLGALTSTQTQGLTTTQLTVLSTSSCLTP